MNEHALVARGLAIGYDAPGLLHGVDLAVARGRFTAVLGPNGAGKTTLLRTLAGLLAPLAGRVEIDGRDVAMLAHADRARAIALVESDLSGAEDLAVEEIVAEGRFAYRPWWSWSATAADELAVDRALELAYVDTLRGRRFGTLSQGERQRVLLALGIATEAPVLVLDEPTSHLDVRHALDVLRLLAELCGQGVTVLASMHDLDRAMTVADDAILLGPGEHWSYGKASDVMASSRLGDAFGASFTLQRTDDAVVLEYPLRARRV